MTMLTGLLEQHAPFVALAILATFVAAIAVSELKEHPAYKVGAIGYARAVLPMPKRFKA